MKFPSALARPARLLMISAALLCGASAQAGLVTNGGFETAPPTGWTQSGNTSFSFFDGFAPHSGNVGASFGSYIDDPALLSQSLTTTAGHLYRLSFWLQNTQGGSDDLPNFFAMNWDGGAAELELSNAAAFDYTEFVYEFTASSSSTDIAFTFANTAYYWDFDDVSVTDLSASTVPEPSTAALLGLALLGGAAASRRRSANGG